MNFVFGERQSLPYNVVLVLEHGIGPDIPFVFFLEHLDALSFTLSRESGVLAIALTLEVELFLVDVVVEMVARVARADYAHVDLVRLTLLLLLLPRGGCGQLLLGRGCSRGENQEGGRGRRRRHGTTTTALVAASAD